MSIPAEFWKGYADAVWREFTKRSRKPERLMSNLEWCVLRAWLDAGIPLRVVLRAMRETDGQPNRLSYYGPSVIFAYASWRHAIKA